tara:strand:+ start:464 stop:775 length:312 start_codon:yes stop_codon:yes gene_type:complete
MKKVLFITTMVSMLISLTIWFTGNKMVALYIGMWCPTILSLEAFLPRKESQKKNKVGRPYGWRKHPNKKHAIKVLRSRGLSYREIATQVGVPKSTVHNYVKGK